MPLIRTTDLRPHARRRARSGACNRCAGRRARRRQRYWIVWAILSAGAAFGPFTGASAGAAGQAAADAPGLYRLLDARLELMDEVAAFKWRQKLPIEDATRETLVLDQAVEDALRFGLTAATSRDLFAAQIEAAKAIQRHWFEVWSSGAGPGAAPDLAAEVRPQLLDLGERIVAAAASQGAPGREDFDRQVEVAGLDAAHRDALYAASRALQRYPHRLAQIADSGVLRVGTTGDYPPFSHLAAAARVPEGIDIDLAEDLAASLGVEVRFVATSWPSLLDDLAAGRYDVAMSGVSRTLDRQRVGFLSRPYHAGGKTPIARCEAAPRFTSLAAIDRPEVRVVVNPGGTNERFVDAHLQHARKLLHDDNRSIFERLIAGDADLMITDQIEVELQARRWPALCPTMPGKTLSYQEKAYLLPQDPVWLAYLDTWLDLALADGTVAQAFRRHGVTRHPPGEPLARDLDQANPAAGPESYTP